MARDLPINVHVPQFDGPLFGGDLDHNEGDNMLTTPIKEYSKYKKRKEVNDTNNDINTNRNFHENSVSKSENEDEKKLKQFINKYKLNKLSKALLNEEITIEFLISQTEQQIDEISKELTSKLIQQNKFKYAVTELKKEYEQIEHEHSHIHIEYTQDSHELKLEELWKIDNIKKELDVSPETMYLYHANKRKEIPIEKKTEIIKSKFGGTKTITTWYFNGDDGNKHEIILKYNIKIDKHNKSKRVIIVDGKERYSSKSNNTNFIINNIGSDRVRIAITYNNDKTDVFYDLFINEIAFDDLMHQKSASFSL